MSISGITVGSVSALKRRPPVGRRRTTGRGDEEDARRGDRQKDEWDVGTPPLPAATANALEAILLGFSHVWDLNGSWASSGAAGVRATDDFTCRFTTGPFSDGAFARVASGGRVDFVGNLGDLWTVLVVRLDGATWKHYGFRSTGNYAVGGVVAGAATLPWFTKQSDGDLQFEGKSDAGANANLDLAQIVAIPAVLPDALLTQATSWLTRRWAAMPVLDVAGDFLSPRSYMLMRAAIDPGDHVGGASERRVLSFSLLQAEGA